MARRPFPVEILSPEGEVFSGEVEMLSTRTASGSIGILAQHAPLLALLEPAELRLHTSESEVVAYAQGEGYLQMTGASALVLVDEIRPRDALDAADLRGRLERARGELEAAQDGTEEQRVARRAVRRYEAFVSLAEAA